jgi:hypothetical protein
MAFNSIGAIIVIIEATWGGLGIFNRLKYRPGLGIVEQAVARATCGIDIKANQSNDVHPRIE